MLFKSEWLVATDTKMDKKSAYKLHTEYNNCTIQELFKTSICSLKHVSWFKTME